LHLSRTVATAVIQLDIDGISPDLRVDEKYTRAFVLVRRRGKPVTAFYTPVNEGRLDLQSATRTLLEDIRKARWKWSAEDYLGPDVFPPTPPATVAICTRERPEDLTRALTAAGALRPAAAEIIVVDSNPATGRTREIVSGFAGVRYVREERRGLDAARNRALIEATTDFVAFTDDDAVTEPEWLGQLLQPFEDPRVMCSTGLTLPLELETAAQEWFERLAPFGRGFARKVFDGTRHDPTAVSRCGAGANMALRRAAVERIGAFDEALDAGTATKSGGDHEMFGRILACGYRLVYQPSAVSWHRHRRTWDELREVLYGYGVGVYAMWTRRLVLEREFGVFRQAWGWLRHDQMPRWCRTLLHRPDSVPSDLLLAELRGCLTGPLAYVASRVRLRIRGKGRA
jgi:cellulose synthase/poly-beta-1,6-N-acetylglucosamine synthase-like glycosyltransferase